MLKPTALIQYFLWRAFIMTLMKRNNNGKHLTCERAVHVVEKKLTSFAEGTVILSARIYLQDGAWPSFFLFIFIRFGPSKKEVQGQSGNVQNVLYKREQMWGVNSELLKHSKTVSYLILLLRHIVYTLVVILLFAICRH